MSNVDGVSGMMDAANSNQMIGSHSGYGMFLGATQRRRDDGRSGGGGGFLARRQEFKNQSRLMNQGAQLQGQLMDKAANNAMTQTTHGGNVTMGMDTHTANLGMARDTHTGQINQALSAQEHSQNVDRDITQGAIGIRGMREGGKQDRSRIRTESKGQQDVDTNLHRNMGELEQTRGMVAREGSQQKFDLEQAGLANLPGHVKGIRDASTYGDLPDKQKPARPSKPREPRKPAGDKPPVKKPPTKKPAGDKPTPKKPAAPRKASRPKPMGQVPIDVEVPGMKLKLGGVHAGDGAQTKL
jgi:hypothetical protein